MQAIPVVGGDCRMGGRDRHDANSEHCRQDDRGTTNGTAHRATAQSHPMLLGWESRATLGPGFGVDALDI
jgi:hypothetical protein